MGSDVQNDVIETTAPEIEEVEQDNRDMTSDVTPLPTINLLDLMQIGADESEQAFGAWSRGENRCALGAMALGARKLGLI